MYTNLWLNGPKEAHELPNHRFDESSPSFVKRPDLYKWLCEYDIKYGQNVNVKYNSQVESVVNGTDDKFSVTWTVTDRLNNNETETFDYIIVAVGHFSVPNLPIFDGEEKFKGKIIH